MTASNAVPPGLLIVGVFVLLAASPLLGAWTAALSSGVSRGWWRWRPVSRRRWATVAALVVMLGVPSAAGRPWPVWLLFSAGAAVLIVVDIERHLLPARLVYPLAAVIAIGLAVASVASDAGVRLLQAAACSAGVAVAWSMIVLVAPSAVGLGDVRLFAVTAGLLGWVSWPAVIYAEAAAFALAALAAPIFAALSRYRLTRRTQIPMGPAIIAGVFLVSWLTTAMP